MSRLVGCPICGRHYHQKLVESHAAGCTGRSTSPNASAPVADLPGAQSSLPPRVESAVALGAAAPAAAAAAQAAAKSSSVEEPTPRAGFKPVQQSLTHHRLGEQGRNTPSPAFGCAPAGTAHAAAAPTAARATRWGALINSDRLRVLEDSQGSVRRTARQWLQCQRADARAYTKCYSNPFADSRPPGSASDNLRDPPHLVMWRIGSATDAPSPAGARRRSHTGLQRRNLLLICRDALNGPGRGALSSAAVQTAVLVLRAPLEAQQLVAHLFYSRGEWHRLSKVTGIVDPAASEDALRQLCRLQLARDTAAAEVEDQAALLSLLKADEIKGLGGASMQKITKKQKTSERVSGELRQHRWVGSGGGGALEKLRSVAALLQDIRGHMQPSPLWTELARRLGTCASLTSSASHTLWELHLLFFSLANYSPEEAASMLSRDISNVVFPAYAVAPALANLCAPVEPWDGLGNDGGDGSTSTEQSANYHAKNAAVPSTEQKASGLGVDTKLTNSALQVLRGRFEELTTAVECSNSLEWAVIHGDSGQAYQAMHEAATALLSAAGPTSDLPASVLDGIPSAGAMAAVGSDGVTRGPLILARLLATKAKEWHVRVVICAVHLLERDQRWDDALHYLEILLGISDQQQQHEATDSNAAMTVRRTRVAAHQRGGVWVRYGIDLEHRNRHEHALKAYEQALADPAVCGEWRVACARAYTRLWKPPRRWGSIRNCPKFATCPTFTLRGKRLPKNEDGFGRSSGGGWLPIGHAESVRPCGEEVDGSSVDGVWLRLSGAAATTSTHPPASAEFSDGAAAARTSCSGSNDTTVAVNSVEEYVRRHYLHHGFEGYHCENRLFLTLFGLLLWDVIHGPVDSKDLGAHGHDCAAGSSEDEISTTGRCEHVVESVPFTSAYQDTPHDLHYGQHFLCRRRVSIDAALQEIEGAGVQKKLRAVFAAHYGEQSRYVQWDWRDARLMQERNRASTDSVAASERDDRAAADDHESGISGGAVATTAEEQRENQRAEADAVSKAVALAELMAICQGLGSRAVVGLCRLYAESYGTWAGGLPDLLVWRRRDNFQIPTSQPASYYDDDLASECNQRWEVRLVEVKGPGDSLSHRQRAWIDRLVEWGVSVCVCHVVAVEAT